MPLSPRLPLALGALLLALLISPTPHAHAGELGPDEVTLFKGTLLDRDSLRHPAGATFVSADDVRAQKLFVPHRRSTSPRLVWKHDLTLLRVYGRRTIVHLKVDGDWYAFTSEGKALREYDLEALGAIDDLERIEVEGTYRPRAHRGERTTRRYAPAPPRARLDLRFYWTRRDGQRDGRPSAPGARPPSPGGNTDSPKLKMMPGYKIIHPKMKMQPGYKIIHPKMKMRPGYKIIHPKMKTQPGYKIIHPKMKTQPGYKVMQPKLKMVPGYKITKPALKMQPGYKVAQPKMKMQQGYKIVQPKK